MPRSSQTDVAVLGALSIEPMTGYQVRQAIGEVLGHFWHESFGQIYPCLKQLEAEGLIRASAGERAASSMFHITAAGRRQLKARLREEPEAQSPRNATLLRVFFGGELDADDLSALIDSTEQAAVDRIAALAEVRRAIESEPLASTHGRYWLATVSAGEHAARAQLNWARETRVALISDLASTKEST